MSDYAAIKHLLYRYARLIDAGDFAAVGQMFAKAEIVAPAAPEGVKGADNIANMYKTAVQLYEDGTPGTKHVISNAIIEIDPDKAETARSEAYLTVFQAAEDFPMQAIIGGRYEDEFVKEAGVWRFHRREIFVDQLGDVSRHLLDASIVE